MKGLIAAGHPQTAAAGANMLRSGGNAIDAAVAAAFASFVAEPTLVSPGGGGYALCYQRAYGRGQLYDFFAAFPGLGAKPSAPMDFFPISIDYGAATQEFHIGRASVATPGNVAGLCRLHADAGRLPLGVVLGPAIDLARNGVPLSPFIAYVGQLLGPIFRNDPALARLFGAPDHFMVSGYVYRNPALAAFLEALGGSGPDLFYRGDVADLILADQRQRGGLLTHEDLDRYGVIVREPLHQPFADFELLTNPPPSRGGALIAFALGLLAGFDLGSLPFGSARHLRLLTEVMQQTNLARPAIEHATDLDDFMAEPNLARHRKEVEHRLTHPVTDRNPSTGRGVGAGNTSHISALDAEGAFVALTTTAGESPGYLLPEAGLILNNILGEADLHPRGFHRGQPGSRIGSMMAPSVLLRHGQPMIALGSGGANRIRSAILQALIGVTTFGFDLQTAVDASRIHFEDGRLQLEGGVQPGAAGWLRRWGYQVVRWPDRHMFFGGVHAVGLGADGAHQAAGDARREGATVTVD